MAYLLDTGILLRLVDQGDAAYSTIIRAVAQLRARGEELAIGFQNASEFWNVSTRPKAARGGYGLRVDQVERRVAQFERMFKLIHESQAVYDEWRRLLVLHGVTGVSVHDAKLVALMGVHGIANVLTLNGSDFRRYPQVTVVAPRDILAVPP